MKSNLTFSLDHDLKTRFIDQCKLADEKQSHVLEKLIEKHLKKESRSKPGSEGTANHEVGDQ
ncbi:hypothetical protein DLD82_08080 [Methanospirillum stamsii]|uniref:CopG family transcriptional regulator n=1 Tax=Methanospirillum stamsii TaxID=1277351 RepID=A0A2V2NB45_9EURY|nr:hypothetical protein DLD82_08080 [Methanospirillum stamsii]